MHVVKKLLVFFFFKWFWVRSVGLVELTITYDFEICRFEGFCFQTES